MIRFKIKDVKKASKDAEKIIQDAIRDPKFLDEVGKLALQNMKINLLEGRDPSTLNPHKNGPAPSTVEARERLKRYNKTPRFYKPYRSLIFTGQLIESLSFRIKKGKAIVELFAKGIHRPYKNSKGKGSGKPISNQELLEIHQFGIGQKKRTLIGLAEKTKRSLETTLRNQLRRILSKK